MEGKHTRENGRLNERKSLSPICGPSDPGIRLFGPSNLESLPLCSKALVFRFNWVIRPIIHPSRLSSRLKIKLSLSFQLFVPGRNGIDARRGKFRDGIHWYWNQCGLLGQLCRLPHHQRCRRLCSLHAPANPFVSPPSTSLIITNPKISAWF